MISRKSLTTLGILVWAAVALTAWPHCKSLRTEAFTVSASPLPASRGEAATGCSDMHFQFDRRGAVTQSEERTISKAEAPTLRVRAESNGGVQVEGWDKDTYSVTLCKAAENDGDAQDLLSQIHMSFQGGELGITGPDSRHRWAAHLLIRSPKASAMDVEVHNGPLSLYDVDGQLRVHAQNGPVTVSGCSGELDLTSQNGPLTLEKNSGKQMVHTHNGPVTVSLSGDSWNGGGLEAEAMNGPVTLEIPSGYRSGVVLESSGRGPFECRASVCSEGRKTWDEDFKRIEFGSGPTVVRVSTQNGPISVH
jgi:hypothetical protein